MDLTESEPLTASVVDEHSVTSSLHSISSHVHTMVPETLPPMVTRANNTPRNSTAVVKSESPARPALTTAPTLEPREVKPIKEAFNEEEQSEYVHHIIDPNVPVYELTHGVPDSLALKCADCSRYARGTSLFYWSLAFKQACSSVEDYNLEIIPASVASRLEA